MPIGRGYIEANVFLGISNLIVKASKWQVSLAEPLFSIQMWQKPKHTPFPNAHTEALDLF